MATNNLVKYKINQPCSKTSSYTEPWTDINILRFLRLYRSHPVLWDATNCGYKNRWMRLSAYRHIVKILKLRNANEDSCIKLVEWLKKRYLEESNSTCESRPVWYKIIKRMIGEILDPNRKVKEASCTSFEACIDCCASQDQVAPCCYFRTSKDGSISVDDVSQAQSSDDEKIPCCCNVGQDYVKIVVLSLKPCLENHDNSDHDGGDCNCETTSTEDNDKSKTVWDCSDLSQASISVKCCIQDSIPSSHQRCDDAVDEFDEMQSTPTTTSRSTSEKTGLFTDSSRARFRAGKPISLTDEYYANDDLLLAVEERTRVIEPRRHYASCCKGECHEFYPLQLDMYKAIY